MADPPQTPAETPTKKRGRRKAWWFLGGAALFLLVIIIAVPGGDDDEEPAEAASTEQPATPAEQPAAASEPVEAETPRGPGRADVVMLAHLRDSYGEINGITTRGSECESFTCIAGVYDDLGTAAVTNQALARGQMVEVTQSCVRGLARDYINVAGKVIRAAESVEGGNMLAGNDLLIEATGDMNRNLPRIKACTEEILAG